MKKIYLGNIKGPQGDPGDPGEGQRGKKGQRGSRIVFGIAITGTSMEERSYQTGIKDSLRNDVYWNEETCNIYVCTLEGDEETAKWSYIGNSKGTETVIENLLTSTNIKNALSAFCGNRLLQCIINTDTNATEIRLKNIEGARTFTVKLTPGTESVITFIDADMNEYASNVIKEDPMKDEETVLKASDLGIPDTAVICMAKSNGGKIRKLTVKDSGGNILFETKPEEEYLFELQDNVEELFKMIDELKKTIEKKRDFHYDTKEPSADIGKDGDIYLRVEE